LIDRSVDLIPLRVSLALGGGAPIMLPAAPPPRLRFGKFVGDDAKIVLWSTIQALIALTAGVVKATPATEASPNRQKRAPHSPELFPL
jgi:hypothetical protein